MGVEDDERQWGKSDDFRRWANEGCGKADEVIRSKLYHPGYVIKH